MKPVRTIASATPIVVDNRPGCLLFSVIVILAFIAGVMLIR